MLLAGHRLEGAVAQNSAEVTKAVYTDIMPVSLGIQDILNSSVHWTPPTLFKRGVARVYSHMYN